MTITLTGAGGLFTRLGKLAFAMNTINTARLTTVPDEIDDYTDEFDNVTQDVLKVIDRVPSARNTLRTAWDSPMATLRESAQRLLLRMVKDDNPQAAETLQLALEELIRQMVASSDSVDASVPGISVAADAGNVGDGHWVTSTKRPDGLSAENILGEDIFAEVTNNGTNGAATVNFSGEEAVSNKLSQDWPGGSGAAGSLGVVNAESTAQNKLLNGGFENEDDLANAPDDWELATATVGTTLKITDVEVQTVAIAGSPTSGTYTLTFTNAASQAQTTEHIDWNATASSVKSALRKLKGLENVEVTATGTSPNFTHTITFNGIGGNLTQLTATSYLDTGSVTPATTTNGATQVYTGGKALDIVGNGSELTAIQQKVTLDALAQYAFSSQWLAESGVLAGTCKVGLWDGNAYINDEQGTENSFTIDLTAVGTSNFEEKTGVFRTPKNLPDIVYLRIALTVAITSAKNVYCDEVALVPMTELYRGGPWAAIFRGSTYFKAGDTQQEGDNWTITPTNGREGAFQEWFERWFDMRDKALLLPSDSGGTETVADSLIA